MGPYPNLMTLTLNAPEGWVHDIYLMWPCAYVSHNPHSIMSLDECEASVMDMIDTTKKSVEHVLVPKKQPTY
jgi:hypothetical protein